MVVVSRVRWVGNGVGWECILQMMLYTSEAHVFLGICGRTRR